MTDKEFKRLSRSQLIDIIYQLQLKQEELTADNKKLAKALADKRLRVNRAGNIAEAALEIHKVMQAAQDAAEHYLEEIKIRVNSERQSYLEEIKIRVNSERQRILKNARAEAAAIISKAKNEAAKIIAQAKSEKQSCDPVVDSILERYEISR